MEYPIRNYNIIASGNYCYIAILYELEDGSAKFITINVLDNSMSWENSKNDKSNLSIIHFTDEQPKIVFEEIKGLFKNTVQIKEVLLPRK